VGGLQTPLGVDIPGFGSEPSWERTFEIGKRVADVAIEALAEAKPVKVNKLEATRREFYVDSDNGLLKGLNARGVFDIPTYDRGESWGPESEHREGVYAHRAGSQIKTEMIAVDFGPAMFLSVPGELSPEIELGGYGRPECPEAHTGRPYEPVIDDQYPQKYKFVLGLGQDELGYIVPGYDFHLLSAPRDVAGGPGVIGVGGLEVETCGEGHYEETVSISSVLAPWVACVAKELAGRNPWTEAPDNAACAYDNMNLGPYGTHADADTPSPFLHPHHEEHAR
jgi:hypothetical protein